MELHESLGFLLNYSARLIKRRLDQELKQYHLTTSQWAVLKILSEHSHISQAELADLTGTDRANCGAVLDKLIAKQFVEKTLSPQDRRSYVVSITPSALELVENIVALVNQTNRQALKGFSKDEQQQFVNSLNLVIKNLLKAR
ncbi:MarR family winged helix-turn-helix transcriptional regulator [Streptococcus tangpeifui]|uniref:MarR family winged helix-turn-helix transcriptional regulator n=1 Tax=Streptococcus tangpeifui TaxID=2709400 RepID=UPI0013E9CBA4|nr:MarR family transcriptional regulator [Streptococcus sp. ZJ1593]